MKDALTAYLLAQAPLTGVIGQRLSWNERPQAEGLPALGLARVSAGISYHHGGATKLERARVQADCWGRTGLDCEAVYAALRTAVEAMHEVRAGTMLDRGFIEEPIDAPPEDLGGGQIVHRIIVDFFVWHSRQA